MLEADLTCPGDGLIVGADGIVIDLGGHVLRGRSFPSAVPGTAGIRNAGHHDVEIRNGTIDDFENGVELVGVTGNRLEALITNDLDSGPAILLVESSENHIRSNQLDCHCGAVINLVDSHRNRVVGNSGATGGGYGLLLVRSTYNEVIDNFFWSENTAIRLEHADHNLLEGNNTYSAYGDAIVLGDSHENRLIANSASNAEDCGVSLSNSHRNLIAENRIGGKTESA